MWRRDQSEIMLYQMCALWFATNFDAKGRRGSYTERMVKYKAHDEVQLLEEQTLIIPQEVSDYSITTCKEFCYKIYPIWSVGIKIREQGLKDASSQSIGHGSVTKFKNRNTVSSCVLSEFSNRPGDVRIGSALLAANHSTKMCKYTEVKHFLHRAHFANKRETCHNCVSPRLGLQLWDHRTPRLQLIKPLLSIAICHKM